MRHPLILYFFKNEMLFVTFLISPVNFLRRGMSRLCENRKYFYRNYLVIQTKEVSLQSVYYPSVKVQIYRSKHTVFVPISLIQMQRQWPVETTINN